ncbi:MAG: hypothetical protein KOO63_09570 [Bacteroidales bacterium]|nr:hypothetical protein [Candidatus Latescibacterota bacterium]
MEIVFLYSRLLSISRHQLDALRRNDFDEMERLTMDRELLTAQICSVLDNAEVDLDDTRFQIRISELTDNISEVDEDIKDILLSELFQRTEELSRIKLVED